MLAATVAIGVGIISLTAVLAYRDQGSLVLGLVMGIVAIGELIILALLSASPSSRRLFRPYRVGVDRLERRSRERRTSPELSGRGTLRPATDAVALLGEGWRLLGSSTSP